MADLLPITPADKLACAQRELQKRREVYPRLIEGKKLSQERADREVAVMEAIAADYARAAALAETIVQGTLLRVRHRGDGAPGGRLVFDVEVRIGGQTQPRISQVDILMNPYGLRCTWLQAGRLIEHLKASGCQSWLPNTKQEEAEAA